jgi:prophage regulatory protein
MIAEQPRLVGAHELRARLGLVNRRRFYRIAGRRDFPTPVAKLAQGKVWLLGEVDDWISEHRTGADRR